MSGVLFFLLGAVAAAALAVALKGPEWRRLSGALSAREAELAEVKVERDRLASELKLLELATEGRNGAVKAENAELRRRMDELADRILALGGPGGAAG